MATNSPHAPRWWAAGSVAVVVALALLACAPAAAPAPAAPAPAQPVATAAAAAPPAAAQPAAATGWQAEWDRVVAAAKQEGKVVVNGAPGQTYRDHALEFQKRYPEITVEYVGATGAVFGPRVIEERRGGQYLWDVYTGGGETPLFMLRPQDVLAPLRPMFLLPEVTDETAWLGGFDSGWVDTAQQHLYMFEGRLSWMAVVNREVVPESELQSVEQLLDPKWKGRIASLDPRRPGASSANNGYLLMLKGEDWLRALLAQDLALTTEGRQLAEFVARGRYPIALGTNPTDIEPLQREGIGMRVEPLAPKTELGTRFTNAFGTVALIANAPHPNAAKVYINWLLSREGQLAYANLIGTNSRRVDVPGPPETAPDLDAQKKSVNLEANQSYITRAIDIANDALR